MKVTCEYCDSYIEVEDNENCPNCGAPLGDVIAAEKEKIKKETEEKLAAIEKKEQEEKEDEVFDKILNAALGAAPAIIGGLAGGAIRGAFSGGHKAPPPPPGMKRR